jgi:RDD family protein
MEMNLPPLHSAQAASPAETHPLGVYASWGARLGAWLIDALLIGFVFWIVGHRVRFGTTVGLEVLTAALYFTLCHSLTGQTIGKTVVGLKVFDSRSLGRLNLPRAVLRWAATALFWIAFVVPGLLDAVSPLWNEDSNQAWHDKIARSVVMRVRGSSHSAETAGTLRVWTSPSLKLGSIAAFALGIIGIPVTLLVALDRSLARGEPNDMFNIDSAAVSHEKLVIAISIGGATIGLFALAVLLGAVQMRRNRLPLRLAELILVVASAAGAAAVVLAAVPATRDSGIPVGLVSIATLTVCWVWVLSALRRNWRAKT